MKRYTYKIEYRNKGLKTRFFDTHRQMLGFVMKSGYTITSIYWKGMCGYICINNYLKQKDYVGIYLIDVYYADSNRGNFLLCW